MKNLDARNSLEAKGIFLIAVIGYVLFTESQTHRTMLYYCFVSFEFLMFAFLK